jgi:methylphosphotriester-DNA--protein-cysteine methyltransferase
MSRSTFALKFKQTVGASPMEYLTRWRMLLAGDKLTNSSDPISVIALSLGYESESASSTAFKGAWAARHGNIAVAGIWLPLPIEGEVARANQLEPIAG